MRSSDLAPSRDTTRLEETGQGRDGGENIVTRIALGGNGEVYARPLTLGLLAYAALGSLASVAQAAPSTLVDHTALPADDQPLLTVWRHMFGSSPQRLVERFVDCKVTQLQIQGSAGNPMTASFAVVGLRFGRLASMPAGGELDRGLPIIFPGYAIKLGGTPTQAVSEFNWNLQAGQNTQQTDQLYDSYMEPGARTLEVTFNSVFESLDLYNLTNYGSASGTDPSPNIAHQALAAAFKDAEGVQRLSLEVPRFAFLTAPLNPNASANEITQYQVTGAGDLPTNGDPVTTAVVANDHAAYAPAA